MRFSDEDKGKNDYWDGPDIPDTPKPEKRPKLSPEDPRYWEDDEDEYDHLRPSRRSMWKLWFWVGLSAIVIGVIIGIYYRVYVPAISMATQYGYVERIEKHEGLVDTFEGVILPYKNLMDTTRVYDGDFIFSTKDADLAAKLIEMEFAHKPVRVGYKVYRTQMPWRGETKVIITEVDSVNPANILPPDRTPEYLLIN